jgi:hypothetical protein
MPHASLQKSIAAEITTRNTHAPTFSGFKAPTSNTTYTPNQFFDVVIPHFSRGVVRIVAYLLRKTLGWCDANGNPQEEQIEVSYSELEERAGVSRDMIRQALDDALAGKLIECVREGRPKLAHDPGQSALYQLHWDGSPAYKVRPAEFQGFFEGEGNRTDIPNEFFDVVIRQEPLSVIKVVGSIIRHSIGFQARHGRRRQQVALSYQHIGNYARFGSRSDLAKAVHTALECNYIIRVEAGVFSPFRFKRHSATYALRWCDSPIGQRNAPAGKQSEIQTSNGQIFEPAERSENRTSIETKPENETVKLPAVPAHQAAAFEKLGAVGFSPKVAAKLAGGYSLENIERQIAWLPHRASARSPLGLLRTAIEENWPAPAKLRLTEVFHERGREFAQCFYAAFGGNQGEPVNQPSAQESEIAEAFVQRLLVIKENGDLIPEWGRALGKTAREQRHPFPSLTLAIRQFGDAMLARMERDRQQAAQVQNEKSREAHLEQHRRYYRAFMLDREKEVQARQVEEYARFTAKRQREKMELEQRPALWTRAMLEHFDTEQSRLDAVQAFFGLPDFWQWDREFNSHPWQPRT